MVHRTGSLGNGIMTDAKKTGPTGDVMYLKSHCATHEACHAPALYQRPGHLVLLQQTAAVGQRSEIVLRFRISEPIRAKICARGHNVSEGWVDDHLLGDPAGKLFRIGFVTVGSCHFCSPTD